MPATDTTTTLAETEKPHRCLCPGTGLGAVPRPENLSMALAAEAAELMEHFLWSTPEQSQAFVRDPQTWENRGRIGDVVIYALEFANVTGIDLATAIEAKMAAKRAKYPVEKSPRPRREYDELVAAVCRCAANRS